MDNMFKIISHDREYAIKAALPYGLQDEIIYCIDILGMTPDEAMQEWDL